MIDARREVGGPGVEHGNEILGQDEADDVVDRFFVHRVARSPALLEQRERFLQRRVDRQRVDVGARRHDVARLLLRELEHALEHVGVALLEHAALLALFDDDAQLFRRSGRSPPRLPAAWPKARTTSDADQLSSAVNGVVSHANATNPGLSDAREALGVGQRGPFGGELAEHHVEERDERDGGAGADRHADRHLEAERQGLEMVRDPRTERGFGQRADGEAGESNS